MISEAQDLNGKQQRAFSTFVRLRLVREFENIKDLAWIKKK